MAQRQIKTGIAHNNSFTSSYCRWLANTYRWGILSRPMNSARY